MATKTRSTRVKIDIDRRTGEARCAHHDLYGNVCDACFNSRPFLMRSYGRTYRMDGNEWTDGMTADDHTLVSAATPEVLVISLDDVQVDDQIIGYTNSPTAPLWVARVVSRGVFIVTPGRQIRIMDDRVAVVRTNKEN